jgi:HEAT repeat protein
MRDVDEVVRMVAAESLAKAGPEGELLLVEAVQRDTIPIVRAAAVHGLMRVGRTTMRSIVGALCDPEAVVRDAAGLALRSIPRRALLRGVKEMPNHQIVITLKAVKNARGLFTNNGDHVLDLLEWLVARLSERHKIIFCKH